MLRCIVYSNENGSREGVIFTDELDAESSDFIPSGCTLSMDFKLEDFPSGFPLNYNLERT